MDRLIAWVFNNHRSWRLLFLSAIGSTWKAQRNHLIELLGVFDKRYGAASNHNLTRHGCNSKRRQVLQTNSIEQELNTILPPPPSSFIFHVITHLFYAVQCITMACITARSYGSSITIDCYFPKLAAAEYRAPTLLVEVYGWLVSFISCIYHALIFIFVRRVNIETLTFMLLPSELVIHVARKYGNQKLCRRCYECGVAPSLCETLSSLSPLLVGDSKSFSGTQLERLACSLMLYECFKPTNDKKVIDMRLRPNRTPEHHIKLLAQVNNSVDKMLATIQYSLIGGTLVCGHTLLFHYNRWYSNACTTSFGSRWPYEHGTLTYLFLMIGLVLALHLILENLRLYLASTILSLPIVNNLLDVWKQIELKLDNLIVRMKQRHCERLNKLDKIVESASCRNNAKAALRHALHAIELDRDIEEIKLENKIYELQALLGDFFVQLRTLNQTVSFLITAVAINLIAQTVAVAAAESKFELKQLNPIYLGLYRLPAIVSATLFFTVCTTIKRHTEATYSKLNTLVVYDTYSDKHRWLNYLSYYSTNKEHGFTLYKSTLVTKMTIVNVMALSLSLIVFLE